MAGDVEVIEAIGARLSGVCATEFVLAVMAKTIAAIMQEARVQAISVNFMASTPFLCGGLDVG